jgi:C-terminal processing protease CtpA/Prc
MIAYWYPYRNVLGEDWNKVLSDFIPRITLAKDADSYKREMLALLTHVHDTHANLWSSLNARPPVGTCRLPVNVRFIENRPVIVSYAGEAGASSGLKAGDIIRDLDGVAVSKLVESWLPYYAASNETTQLRDIAGSLTNGQCGETKIHIRRENQEMDITTERVAASKLRSILRWHDLPGDTFRLLSPEVAYLKLSSVKGEDTAHYIERAAGTTGLIIDIRNYPSAFMPFALGSLLVDKETEFVRFTTADLSNPGAFHWNAPLTIKPEKPHYSGKIVILVDEISQSQSEYTTMALRSVPQAKVLGSTTAGADGNVSQIPLPGGLSSMISALGIFYPDKKPTQRIGILPDVEVRPTIAGIRDGRDEVLEAAVRQILGAGVPAAEIEKIAKP